MYIDESKNHFMDRCPRFISCSVPICPLDLYNEIRVFYPEEPKCDMAKRVRFLIGKDLPKMGLTNKEYIGYIRCYGNRENVLLALLKRFCPSDTETKPLSRVMSKGGV